MSKITLLISSFLILIIWNGYAQTGNVGVGNTAPAAKLDIAGDLALREGTAISLSGASPAVTVTLSTANPENSFYRITGSPTGTMTLNSIANGVDGQIITLVNATTIKLKISNNNAANGILTSGGATTLIVPNGSITLQYSSGASRWFVTNVAGATITDWIKATTTDEPAISTDAQYVTGNVGLGGHTGGASDNTYNFANNAPNAPLVVVSSGAATAASTPTATGLRLAMPGTNGTKWPVSADFKLGSYATSSANAQSQLDIALGNGATATPDATIMSILGNGNVGIGKTTPSAPLHVVISGATDQYVARFTQTNTTTGNSTFIGLGSENVSTSKASIGFQRTDAYDKGDMTFNVVNNNTSLVDATEADERMRIRSDGNVGINTTAPTSKLFVKSADNTSTTEIATFMANNSTYGVGITYNGIKATGSNAANALYLDSKTTGYLLMQTNATGNVGIGTATPARKLEVNNAIKLTNSSADANDGIIGTATFDVGLNIVGINTDATFRKISMWGGIRQIQNDVGNRFLNTNYFEGDGNIIQIGSPSASSNPTILPRNPIGGANATYLRLGSSSNSLQDLYSNFIYVNNRVHIGGTAPTNYPLLVEGSNSWTGWNRWYDDGYGSSWSGWSSATANVAIYSPQSIMTDVYFIAASDKRIKKDFSISDSKTDLQSINNIQITNYKLIDSFSNGNRPFKKVIAQQVEKVYPEAISNTTGFIPNIYTPSIKSELVGNKIILTLAKAHELKNGDKVKVYDGKGKQIQSSVLVLNDFSFSMESEEIKETGAYFVFGKEVNDFKTVDYDALAMLNISATQELYKKIMALEKENAELKTTLSIKADNADIQQLKAQVEELKKLILNTALKAEK